MYPFLQSKQLIGLLYGPKGAAEYEALVGEKGKCRKRDASSECGTCNHYSFLSYLATAAILQPKGRGLRKDSNFLILVGTVVKACSRLH